MPSHRVPFLSQFSDLGHHEWRARGCGITALKMAMDFWHGVNSAHPAPSLEELLDAGLKAGAYREGIGWSHAGLVALAHRYGYAGFNVDVAAQSPTPKLPHEAWAMVAQELEHGPLLVSIFAGLDHRRGGGHIAVLTGAHDNLIFLNDPEEMSAREGCKTIALEAFLPAFKQRYMVIRP